MRIFDYVDREVPVLLRMFEKRLRAYRALGYARGEATLDDAIPLNEPTTEYADLPRKKGQIRHPGKLLDPNW